MITKKMNIAVAGTGYVGLSLATLLAQKHHVTALDIVEEKVKMINDRISPIQDECIRDFFEEKELEFILKRFERMKVKFMNEIYMLEDENSLGLFLGKCNLCMRCTREFNMPCKMPFKMRYSLESLGGKVDESIRDIFGYEIKYAQDGKLPEYLIFVGGLLYDKK